MKKIEGAANKLETTAQLFAVVTCHMFILSMCVVTEGIWKRQLLFNYLRIMKAFKKPVIAYYNLLPIQPV